MNLEKKVFVVGHYFNEKGETIRFKDYNAGLAASYEDHGNRIML